MAQGDLIIAGGIAMRADAGCLARGDRRQFAHGLQIVRLHRVMHQATGGDLAVFEQGSQSALVELPPVARRQHHFHRAAGDLVAEGIAVAHIVQQAGRDAFRQLPGAVPGSARLFVNLLSAGVPEGGRRSVP